VLLAIPAVPFALLARVLSRLRERAADAGAARLTGSPAAVAAALVALSEHLAQRRPVDLRAAAPAVLNILPLRPAHGIARLWATHPPLAARLRAGSDGGAAAGAYSPYERPMTSSMISSVPAPMRFRRMSRHTRSTPYSFM
jgi:hypothetical protein